MRSGLARQRGVVTVIAAVFIIVTIALMVEVLHRMTGSDILDTAVHNDSVEALFIAETGIESASYRYASGTGCAALTPFTDNAGGGSFTISSAAVVGTDCRIRVQASASSTGLTNPNASTRTLDADLRLGGIGAWAVGKNGVLYSWNGSNWTTVTSPTTETLNAVHCVTANECWAVGRAGVIVHYSGGSWTQTVLDSNEEYKDVACAPNNPAYCFIVGKDGGGVIRFWNGSSWSSPTATADDLDAVTCPSTICYAVGKKDQPPLRYNGSSWIAESDNVTKDLKGVHCYSDTGCWAVGKKINNDLLFAQRPGGSFTWDEVSGPALNKDLESVYCVASDDCWAVGKKLGGNNNLIVHWDGSSWTQVSAGSGDDLKDVVCASANDCFAVGKKGIVLHWDGSSWSDASTGVSNGDELVGVSFTGGGGGGSVTLVRWQEIISN